MASIKEPLENYQIFEKENFETYFYEDVDDIYHSLKPSNHVLKKYCDIPLDDGRIAQFLTVDDTNYVRKRNKDMTWTEWIKI